MENSLMMLLHGLIIGVIFFAIMYFPLKQQLPKAQDRSILIGVTATAYMVLFGHALPTTQNENIWKS